MLQTDPTTTSTSPNSERKTNFKILINFLWIVVVALFVFGLGFLPQVVEYLYSNGLYIFTSAIQRLISRQMSIAIGDFLYMGIGVYILWSVYRFIWKLFQPGLKKPVFWKVLIKVVQFPIILYIIFKLSWGLNYSRVPIAGDLGISNHKYNQAELLSLGTFLITKVNNLQPSRNSQQPKWTIDELEWQTSAAYRKTARIYPFFNYPIPTIKRVLLQDAITRLGIEGFYNPISGEANVNMQLPVTSLPFVSCHEVAHQLGIGREDEANLIGYLAAIHSDNIEFRYCGYYAMLRSVLVEIGKSMPQIYSTLYYTVNKQTISEFERDHAFWLKYNSEMYGYMDMTFDKFLKLNAQPKGTDSYQDIVIWLYNYHKKEI